MEKRESPGASDELARGVGRDEVDVHQSSAPRRRKRLSADLPQHWLHDPAYWNLSDAAWRLHTHALMWAIGRTDGQIPLSMLTMLLPGTDADRARAAQELVDAGRWADTETGWALPDWDEHQSTVEVIDNNRRRERDKKRRQRSTDDVPQVVPPGTPPGESTGGVRNGTAGHVKGEVLDPPVSNETCRDCGAPKPAWILESRDGRCIECARAAG